MGKQKLTQKKSTNHLERINIIRKVILNRVKTNTRTIASNFIGDQAKIDNIVQSIGSNVKTQLEENNCLNKKVLEKFFGLSLECMVQDNIISNIQTKCKCPTRHSLICITTSIWVQSKLFCIKS